MLTTVCRARRRPTALVALVALVPLLAAAACAPAALPAPGPVPVSAPPPEQPQLPAAPAQNSATNAPSLRTGGPWSYTPAAGSFAYLVTTQATITSDSGGAARSLGPASQRAVVAVTADGDVQAVEPPAPQAGTPCDANAALATHARELIPRLPPSLVVGATWTDSSTTSGCRGPIPATTHLQSGFVVVGDTLLRGVRAVQVHRADTLAANGEGASGQHRILLRATGTASTELFFDPAAGRFLGSDGTQVSAVAISTSGRTAHFEQRVREHVELAGAP